MGLDTSPHKGGDGGGGEGGLQSNFDETNFYVLRVLWFWHITAGGLHRGPPPPLPPRPSVASSPPELLWEMVDGGREGGITPHLLPAPMRVVFHRK